MGKLTFWKNLPNGRPLSRANANNCREAVAMLVIPQKIDSEVIMAVMAVAPGLDMVAL